MGYTLEMRRSIGLAGVLQCAILIDQLAQHGEVPNPAAEGLIHSIFQTDPPNVEAIYGSINTLECGLESLTSGMIRKQQPHILRYFLNLTALQRRAKRDQILMEEIALGIELNRKRLEHYPLMHDNIIAGLAEIYRQTLSPLKPKIMVRGNVHHLQQPHVANYIRTLCLAGVRSSMLWQQSGGKGWHLLFGLHHVTEHAEAVLMKIRGA